MTTMTAQPSPEQSELTLADRIERSIIDGDMMTFRELVFADYENKVPRKDAVTVLQDGFRFGEMVGVVFHRSVVATCMVMNRPEFVRELMLCVRQLAKQLPGDEPSVYKDWFSLLCSAKRGDEFEFVSPPQLVRQMRDAELSDYREFILMTIEYLPLDEGLYRARNRSDENQAFITECEMEVRIRQVKAAAPLDETVSAPARRARCL